MKNYYDLLVIFTAVRQLDHIEESVLVPVERALLEAFKALEPWEQDMLTKSMCPEAFEVIMQIKVYTIETL